MISNNKDDVQKKLTEQIQQVAELIAINAQLREYAHTLTSQHQQEVRQLGNTHREELDKLHKEYQTLRTQASECMT